MPGFAADAVSEVWLEATVRAAAGWPRGGRQRGGLGSRDGSDTRGAGDDAHGTVKTIAVGLMAAGAVVAAMVGAGAAIAARRHAEPAAARAEAGQAVVPPLAKAGPWIKGVVVDTSGRPVAAPGSPRSGRSTPRP